ncbi:PrsW family intramembrane metalloprotease [Agromyces intestinalis]|uniref:PrsW family intramembrane metalloprotease n=1 Tax=Agromyces intestinalis TaxID=2592652 RepID=A0A5C1YMI2_9MICO|nr:PrsW family intramembrane metalloprotease [Agromyces intestinalis]
MLAVVGIAVGALALLLVVAYLIAALGVPTLAVGSLLAVVPLVIVLLAVRWVDRWEPEPRWALWFAFLWGAGVSVAVALLVDLGVQVAVAFATPGGATDEALQAVVQAPLVEELAKGLGVLLVFAFSRSHFDGPIDGLVYAATVAAGFAFTENVLYFGAAMAEGGAGEVGLVFVVRGLFSPFAHVLFTACTGLMIGIGARRGATVGIIGWFALGLVGAIALHALWNGSLAFAGEGAIALYFTVQVPIFIGAIVLTVLLRGQEARLTRDRLAEYAAAGWLTRGEVDALATPAGRRQAIAWARAQRPQRTAEVRALISDATALAFNRQMVVSGRTDVRHARDERALLDRLTARRAALLR